MDLVQSILIFSTAGIFCRQGNKVQETDLLPLGELSPSYCC